MGQSTNWLGVQGGRENCANYSGFRLELKKDVAFFLIKFSIARMPEATEPSERIQLAKARLGITVQSTAIREPSLKVTHCGFAKASRLLI